VYSKNKYHYEHTGTRVFLLDHFENVRDDLKCNTLTKRNKK